MTPTAQETSAPRKDERLEARVSPETKALLQQAATLEGRSLTDFVVNSAVESSKRILRERELMGLSQRDRAVFVDTLLNPPAPNARLQHAAERYKHVFAGR